MITDEDRRRLVESRHDIAACEKASELSPSPAFQSAVTTSRAELSAADAALRTAIASVFRERGETDAERAKLDSALDAAVRRYGFARLKVQDALLNVDPDTDVASSEIVRRQNLFARVFKLAPSDLEKMGHATIVELLRNVVESLAKEPDLAPLGLAPSLSATHTAAEKAEKELRRETDEDAMAMANLRAARAAFDRAHSAHALLVESILVRHDRKDELGRFILAKDPSYVARRSAKVPISQEPGAGDIESPTNNT